MHYYPLQNSIPPAPYAPYHPSTIIRYALATGIRQIDLEAMLELKAARGGGPRDRARGTPLSPGAAPNDLWCADFKGEFKLGNRRYCYRLTVTDHASRFLLLCEALESTREDRAFTAF
jgi:transposase InsO family protein